MRLIFRAGVGRKSGARGVQIGGPGGAGRAGNRPAVGAVDGGQSAVAGRQGRCLILVWIGCRPLAEGGGRRKAAVGGGALLSGEVERINAY